MTEASRRPNDEERERLVAYLDGELPAAESEALEAQAVSDEPTRQALRDLDRVWNALDALPMPRVDRAFTKTTVAMVAATSQREVEAETAALPARKRRSRVAMWLLIGAAACLAFVPVRLLATRSDRQLLEELPVVSHAAVLGHFEGIAFLERLAEAPGGTLPNAQRRPIVDRAVEWETVARATQRERAEWVRALEPQTREELAKHTASFNAMTPQRRQQLRQTSREIDAHPDAVGLRRLALAYHEVVSQRSPGDQAQLREMPDRERISQLGRLARGWVAQRYVDLGEEDRLRFRAALVRLAHESGRAGGDRVAPPEDRLTQPRTGDRPAHAYAAATRAGDLPGSQRPARTGLLLRGRGRQPG